MPPRTRTTSSSTARPQNPARNDHRTVPTKAAKTATPATPRRPAGVRGQLQELKEQGALVLWLRGVWQNTPGLSASFLIHAVLLVILALMTLAPPLEDVMPNLLAVSDSQSDEEIDQLQEAIDVPAEVTVEQEVSEVVETVITSDAVEISSFHDAPAAQIAVETSDFGLEKAVKNSLLSKMGATTGRGFDGRGEAARRALVAAGGGSAGSETAVGHALKWFAEHQMTDGGWSFHHGLRNKHEGPVNNAGMERSTAAATAMALLPFLGAGQTHKEGKYQDTVQRGLYYLCQQMKVTPNGGDLRGLEGGTMYCHGLAAITLCEAYALSQDKSLAVPAQQAINFIVYAQDKNGGGWRYQPGEPGDTSCFGWQLMALKSGHLAYLDVPPKTIAGAIHFLDTVQGGSGARFGYLGPGDGPATTAIGLLSRMYLGMKPDHPALTQGVDFLSQLGPAKNNMYFNYYATQVLHHWGNEPWQKWNEVMRDQLVTTQVQQGSHRAEKGSWWTPGQQHGENGGRLYETSLSCMTLEVYYRHLPLYRKQVAEGDEF